MQYKINLGEHIQKMGDNRLKKKIKLQTWREKKYRKTANETGRSFPGGRNRPSSRSLIDDVTSHPLQVFHPSQSHFLYYKLIISLIFRFKIVSSFDFLAALRQISICVASFIFAWYCIVLKGWLLLLGTPSLKSLPEDLCSRFLRPEKIHRHQPGLNPQT